MDIGLRDDGKKRSLGLLGDADERMQPTPSARKDRGNTGGYVKTLTTADLGNTTSGIGLVSQYFNLLRRCLAAGGRWCRSDRPGLPVRTDSYAIARCG